MPFRLTRMSPFIAVTLISFFTSACISSGSKKVDVPANKFDLSHWSINVPTDVDNDQKVDEIKEAQLQSFSHPDFFHLDELGRMVFTAPNKAVTTKNSSNTRSELRYNSRGPNRELATRDPANNFAIKAHPEADQFASIGGRMEATLHVDAVSRNTQKPGKRSAYSAVIGQIHAVKFRGQHETAGWGNEPLKIFYKKWPGHDKGSIFWTNERNLAKANPQRRDIVYPVWGNTWEISADPGDEGIALGQEFSYTVNVHENIMTLTFAAQDRPTVRYDIDLSNNTDAYGNVDTQDNPLGYTGDSMYFKAGVYNQCNTKSGACGGTGDWSVDRVNGDFARVTFSKLVVSDATAN